MRNKTLWDGLAILTLWGGVALFLVMMGGG